MCRWTFGTEPRAVNPAAGPRRRAKPAWRGPRLRGGHREPTENALGFTVQGRQRGLSMALMLTASRELQRPGTVKGSTVKGSERYRLGAKRGVGFTDGMPANVYAGCERTARVERTGNPAVGSGNVST